MSTSTQRSTSNALVQFLLSPQVYPDHPSHVELRETHISWVFLTDHYAYKLKKPVRFDFLDFSTVDRRRRACELEVKLNSYWAPGVYLGVVPIRRDDRGDFVIGGNHGTVIDWMVRMQRLPDDLRLDLRIRRGQMTDQDRHRVVAHLVRKYLDLPPLTVRAEEYRDRVEKHVQGNYMVLRATRELSAIEVERCHRQQIRWIRLMGDELRDRARNGRIVDGHGDLRPDHIYLLDPPAIVDCVEFSEDLRRVDTLDDLAFLAMDCAVLEETKLGEALLADYRRLGQDVFSSQIYALYYSYRAAVRAKVYWLRASQGSVDRRDELLARSAKYLRMADDAAASLLPPIVIIMRGVSGSGKSTLAKSLSKQLVLTHLSTDRIRQSMFGPESAPSGWQKGHYSASARKRVYTALFQAATQHLAQGLSVLLDGTFLDEADCRAAMEVAERYGAVPLVVECRCPVKTIRSRLASRVPGQDMGSEASWDVAQRQLERFGPLPWRQRVAVDTTASMSEQVAQVVERLRAEVRAVQSAKQGRSPSASSGTSRTR